MSAGSILLQAARSEAILPVLNYSGHSAGAPAPGMPYYCSTECTLVLLFSLSFLLLLSSAAAADGEVARECTVAAVYAVIVGLGRQKFNTLMHRSCWCLVHLLGVASAKFC